MLGLRGIAGTGLFTYVLIAFTRSDPMWIRHATAQALNEVFIVWMLAAVFVGALNWILE